MSDTEESAAKTTEETPLGFHENKPRGNYFTEVILQASKAISKLQDSKLSDKDCAKYA